MEKTLKLDFFSYSPYENLAAEEILCEMCAREGKNGIFLWQNRDTVVIGQNQNPWRECNLSAMERDGVRLARRKTGGGAVFHDMGNLNFSFCSPRGSYNQDINYRIIVEAVRKAGIPAEINGRNDITADGRKFSGNAFRHTQGFSLAHGTLLVSSELTRLSNYLTPSEDKLKAKGVTSVKSRVVNLSELSPGLDIEKLRVLVESEFVNAYGDIETVLSDRNAIEKLAGEYASWEFLYGGTPEFEIELNRRFPFGGIMAGLSLKNGKISDCMVWSDMLDTSLPKEIATCLKGCCYTKSSIISALSSLSEHPEIAQIISEIGDE